MKVEMKLTGLDGVLKTLQSLPPEIVSKRGGPVKSALRKGALVILKQAKANLQASIAHQNGPGSETTGLLLKNLIASRGRPQEKGERYLVRVKRKVYARTGGKPVTTTSTGRWLEYGSRDQDQPAEPWLRPAFASKAREAITTIESELVKGVDKAVAKLSAQSK